MKEDDSLKELIDQRLKDIETYIIEGRLIRTQIKDLIGNTNKRLGNMEETINGKGNEKGIVDRVRSLEYQEQERVKVKDGFLKIAVGSITMAVGAFVLWICKLVFGAIGKGG